ncbi:hypothetical protein PIB30_040947, partial [Stylosanthes scabra]|nr:hypothetical protein [Stylosanthes scabra]
QEVSQIIDDASDSSNDEEEEQAPQQQPALTESTEASSPASSNSKPLMGGIFLVSTANSSNPGRSKHWRCKHYLKEFISFYCSYQSHCLELHCHFFGPPAEKGLEFRDAMLCLKTDRSSTE